LHEAWLATAGPFFIGRQQPPVLDGRFPRADVDQVGAGSGRTITTFIY